MALIGDGKASTNMAFRVQYAIFGDGWVTVTGDGHYFRNRMDRFTSGLYFQWSTGHLVVRPLFTITTTLLSLYSSLMRSSDLKVHFNLVLASS
jgi:hypothetical protein